MSFEINNQLLIEACRSGDASTAKILLKHGRVDDCNKIHQNHQIVSMNNNKPSSLIPPCLLLAASSSSPTAPELVQTLIQEGNADIYLRMEGNGVSALHAAASVNSCKVIEILMKKHQSNNSNNNQKEPNFVNCETHRDGLTPLHFACKVKNTNNGSIHRDQDGKQEGSAVRTLLHYGADCFKLSKQNSSVFHVCAQSSNVEALKEIYTYLSKHPERFLKHQLKPILTMKETVSGKTAEELVKKEDDDDNRDEILLSLLNKLKECDFTNDNNDSSSPKESSSSAASPSPPPPDHSPPAGAISLGHQQQNGQEETRKQGISSPVLSLFDPFEKTISQDEQQQQGMMKKTLSQQTFTTIDLFSEPSHSTNQFKTKQEEQEEEKRGEDKKLEKKTDLLLSIPSSPTSVKRSPLHMKLFGPKPDDNNNSNNKQKEEVTKKEDETENQEEIADTVKVEESKGRKEKVDDEKEKIGSSENDENNSQKEEITNQAGLEEEQEPNESSESSSEFTIDEGKPVVVKELTKEENKEEQAVIIMSNLEEEENEKPAGKEPSKTFDVDEFFSASTVAENTKGQTKAIEKIINDDDQQQHSNDGQQQQLKIKQLNEISLLDQYLREEQNRFLIQQKEKDPPAQASARQQHQEQKEEIGVESSSSSSIPPTTINKRGNRSHHDHNNDSPEPTPSSCIPTPTPRSQRNVNHHHWNYSPTTLISPLPSLRRNALKAKIPQWLLNLDTLPEDVKIRLVEEKVTDEEDFYDLTNEDLQSINMALGDRKKVLRIVAEGRKI